MLDPLYLDTARLGRTSPSAQRAEHAAALLAAKEGNSAFFERLVRDGLGASPLAGEGRYSGLGHWAGVGELKQSLRALAGHRPDLPVLVAQRSAQLTKLAARVLFHSCRNVLVTDLGWPGYHDILTHEATRANRRVTGVDLRTEVLYGRLQEAELIDRVCATFGRERCDGLFLTGVSNWGVRLPVERIVRRLEASHRVWFVVVDGAQEFCHIPGQLGAEYCDLYLTGCHKWLGAHHPLGLGFYGQQRSRAVIDTVSAQMTGAGDLDDPLLRFSEQLETGTAGVTETLSLLPLFTARAAVEDASRTGTLSCRTDNAAAVIARAPGVGWNPLSADVPLRSGILLLEAERAAVRATPPDELRLALRDAGVAATVYEGGIVRLSMPPVGFATAELERLTRALHRVA